MFHWHMQRRPSSGDKADGYKLEVTIPGRSVSYPSGNIWSTYVKVAFPTPISPSYLETCFQQSRNNLEDVAFSKAF